MVSTYSMFILFFTITLSVIFGTIVSKILFREYHTALGFAGGAIIALVCVDIIPHLFEHSDHTENAAHFVPLGILLGFLLMHVFEKVAGFHEHTHSHSDHESHHHVQGVTSLVLLSTHAFIDGIGIGAAYALSPTLASTVLAAFLLHKILDGATITSLTTAHKKPLSFFLIVNIFLTMIGVLIVRLFIIPETMLLVITACVAGALLYVSSAHILPEAHAHKFAWKTIFATWLGALIVVAITFLH